MTSTILYHVSGSADLAALQVGATFTLRPGPQGAEGRGVYFAEGVRLTAAEGAAGCPAVIVAIAVADSQARAWWRTKPSVARKHGRPRTWHSAGADVRCEVVERDEWSDHGLPVLRCSAERVVEARK